MADASPTVRRRDGAETKRRAQRVALELFTEQGYESTTLRQIADRLGINKASLYYHFPGKEAIVRSLFEERGGEAEDLAAWVEQAPATTSSLEEAILRWVRSFSTDKLQGIRFLRANPILARTFTDADGDRIGDPLNRLASLLSARLPDPTPTNTLLVRMAVLGINAAVEAAAGADFTDAEVTTAAVEAARALLDRALTPADHSA